MMIFFGYSKRSSDYAQAIMELGALVCRPSNPLCFECPISQNCISFKKNNSEVIVLIINKSTNNHSQVV